MNEPPKRTNAPRRVHLLDAMILISCMAALFAVIRAVAALTRIIIGVHVEERAFSITLVVLLCLGASAVYWWAPPLPE